MGRGVRVCPNCGSTAVKRDRTDVISLLALAGNHECQECGYSGVFPETDHEEVENVVEEIRERGPAVTDEPENASFDRGRLVIGIVLFVLGLTASFSAPLGNGFLAGVLALAIGAAIIFEQIQSL